MALYGLSIFNLHYWGFGIPFLLFGSWYLVRAYRLQQKLQARPSESADGAGPGRGVRPRPSKRYTPAGRAGPASAPAAAERGRRPAGRLNLRGQSRAGVALPSRAPVPACG